LASWRLAIFGVAADFRKSNELILSDCASDEAAGYDSARQDGMIQRARE